ncbi:hypothetical protein EVAR_43587_1 [Eumeta japonica]|uniref:Uncharacterized protein n=1 Tax=Eumeta variegata TaxID=151549 RepID=A0A4C1XEY8_EUMVA|nr:hypothetical protein EVAR_43587_1 [Eumeta japonica]
MDETEITGYVKTKTLVIYFRRWAKKINNERVLLPTYTISNRSYREGNHVNRVRTKVEISHRSTPNQKGLGIHTHFPARTSRHGRLERGEENRQLFTSL